VGCPGASSEPSSTPTSVAFEGSGDVGVLTVTNTFTAPTVAPEATPAAAVVATPNFTG
jgi:hypothetical protein